jgi:hypothetical protein
LALITHHLLANGGELALRGHLMLLRLLLVPIFVDTVG